MKDLSVTRNNVFYVRQRAFQEAESILWTVSEQLCVFDNLPNPLPLEKKKKKLNNKISIESL